MVTQRFEVQQLVNEQLAASVNSLEDEKIVFLQRLDAAINPTPEPTKGKNKTSVSVGVVPKPPTPPTAPPPPSPQNGKQQEIAR